MSIFNNIGNDGVANGSPIRKIGGYIDVTTIDEDVVPCIEDEAGNHTRVTGNRRAKDPAKIFGYTIHPKRTFKQLQYVIDIIKKDPKTQYLEEFLRKPIIFTYEIDTACTDGDRIYFSPIFAEDMYVKDSKNKFKFVQSDEGRALLKSDNVEYSNKVLNLMTRTLRFIIIHECYHMLYQHIRRERVHLGDEMNGANHNLANEAQDIEINRDIEGCFKELSGITEEIHGCWYKDARYGREFKKDIFEDIYDYLKARNFKADGDQMIGEDQLEPEQDDVDTDKNYDIGWDFAFDSIDKGLLTYEQIEKALYALN